ncbi:hypothetical protein AB0873_10085 [Micromonospora sp. NPDC047707]
MRSGRLRSRRVVPGSFRCPRSMSSFRQLRSSRHDRPASSGAW